MPKGGRRAGKPRGTRHVCDDGHGVRMRPISLDLRSTSSAIALRVARQRSPLRASSCAITSRCEQKLYQGVDLAFDSEYLHVPYNGRRVTAA